MADDFVNYYIEKIYSCTFTFIVSMKVIYIHRWPYFLIFDKVVTIEAWMYWTNLFTIEGSQEVIF